jgi:hypothetical protein
MAETDHLTFLADLHLTLAESQRDVLEAAIERVDAALKGGTETEWTRLAKEMADTTACSERTGLAVLKCVAFLAMRFVTDPSAETGVERSVSEIRRFAQSTDGGLKQEEEPKLTALLQRLAGEAGRLKKAAVAGRVIRGVLPMFEDLQATVEMRSTRPPLRASDENESSPFELIPIASLRLVLDSGDPQTLGFQATDEDLAEIQRRVEQLRKELKELKERVEVK